jgi:hypothetical protein
MSDSYAIARNYHGQYCVPLASRHSPAARMVLAGDIREAATIDVLRAAAPGDIVHAGAYFGDFLPALAK